MLRTALPCALLLFTTSAASAQPKAETVTSKGGVVVCVSPPAADVGLAVLKRGGNAVDAAIAVQAMLSLVEPQSSGVGGGAFMTYFDGRTRKITVYDGREVAPAQAVSTMFLDNTGKPLPFATALLSGRATGVPGVMKMLATFRECCGVRRWFWTTRKICSRRARSCVRMSMT